MGRDLRAASQRKAPIFLGAALKDPIGAKLNHYHIVKGWMHKDGKPHDNGLQRRFVGRPHAPRAGRKTATRERHRGPGERHLDQHHRRALPIAGWQNLEFNPKEVAFCYGRVIETPTPRWSDYDAKSLGAKPLPGAALTLPGRANRSPIWYMSAKQTWTSNAVYPVFSDKLAVRRFNVQTT